MPDALDAGSVHAELGGIFDPAGFAQFDAAMKKSAASAEAFEAEVAASTKRLGELGPASSKASGGMSELEKANRRAEASLFSLGHTAKVGAAAGLLAVVAATAVAVKQAADFERAMRNVNSIAKLNDTQFKQLSNSVLHLSGKTAQTPKQLADGLYDLVSSGIKAKDSIGVLKAAAIAASAGLTDTQTAIVPLVGALNAYHLKAGDAAKVSDVLFQIVNRGVVHFKDLAIGLGPVLPLAASLKIPLNDVGAAISTLTKQGIPAADAFTYMANGMKVFLAPHKTLQAAIEKTGFATGDALVKAKGFQGALEAVAGTTNGTKGELAKLFPDIRALKDVLGLTGANAQKAAEDLAGFTASATKGSTAQVFAEQAKSASFQFQQLKADLSAVAIEVGTVVLPMFNSLAHGAETALTGFIKSGGAKNLGSDLSTGFREAGHVIKDLVPIAKDAAGALGDVSHALDLGNANHLEALGVGFLSFKAAGVVAPMVTHLAVALRGMKDVGFAEGILGMIGPFKLVAAAAAILGGSLVLLSGHEDAETAAAKRLIDIKKEEKRAIEDALGDERSTAQKAVDAHNSNEQVKQDQRDVNKLRQDGKTHTEEYRNAVNRLAGDQLQAHADQSSYDTSQATTAQRNADRVAKAYGDVQATKSRIKSLQGQIARDTDPRNSLVPPGAPGYQAPTASPKLTGALAAEQENLVAENEKYIAVLARQQVSETSIQHLRNAGAQVTQKNALGVAQLIAVINGLPTDKQTKILLSGDQDALGRLGTLINKIKSAPGIKEVRAVLTGDQPFAVKVEAIKALVNGVPPSKVAKIIADTDGQSAKLAALQAQINAMEGKRIDIEVRQIHTNVGAAGPVGPAHPKRAAGRGPGRAEMALVGEGRAPEDVYDTATGEHTVVSKPTFMALPGTAVVVPRDKQYAGRAAGFMKQIAAAMGWPAHEAGTGFPKSVKNVPKKWQNLFVPKPLDPLKLPVDDIQTKRDAALKKYDDAKQYIHDEPDKIKALRTRETDLSHTKVKAGSEAARKKAEHLQILRSEIAAANKKLSTERRELPDFRKAYQARETQLREAKAYAAKIVKAQSLVDIDRNNMDLANKHHDQKAYDKAKAKRLVDLKTLHDLYANAQEHVPKDSQYFLELQKNIGSTDVDSTDTGNEQSDDQSQAADDLKSTGMTPAERDALSKIKADEALAALTPDTADDLAAYGREATLLQQVLGEVQADPAGRGGNDVIAQIAGDLQTARDTIKSVSADVTPDMQAQIDQANARADAATANSRAATDALAAFGSSGDIGVGGYRDAAQAAAQGPTVVFQSYVPPTPAQAFELGGHVVRGMSYQNPRQSPRIQTGA